MDMCPPSQVSEHLGLNEVKQMQTSVRMSRWQTLFFTPNRCSAFRETFKLLLQTLFLLLLSLGSAMIFFGLNMNILDLFLK